MFFFCASRVAAPRGDAGLVQMRRSVEATLRERSRGKPKVGKGYIKNQVSYQKKRAALSQARHAIRHRTRASQTGEATEWFPLKGQASCFISKVDAAQMIAVPCVRCVATQTLALCWHREEETLFFLSGLEEGGRALSRALPTPMLSLSAGLPCPPPTPTTTMS